MKWSFKFGGEDRPWKRKVCFPEEIFLCKKGMVSKYGKRRSLRRVWFVNMENSEA